MVSEEKQQQIYKNARVCVCVCPFFNFAFHLLVVYAADASLQVGQTRQQGFDGIQSERVRLEDLLHGVLPLRDGPVLVETEERKDLQVVDEATSQRNCSIC